MTDPAPPPTGAPDAQELPAGERPAQEHLHPRPHFASPFAWVVSLLLAAVVGALLFAGGYLVAGGSGATNSCAAPSQSFAALCDAYEKLKTQFVDKLDDRKLAQGAIQGMFQYGVADPFSGYMPPDQYQRALGDLSGKFQGIGAEMALKNTKNAGDLQACTQLSDTCVLVVVAPIAGSPAEAAGLRAGDVVSSVDGKSVNGTTMQDQISKVRGPAGTKVTLTIKRAGRTFDVAITRSQITVREVVTKMLAGNIGYIKLNGFSESSPDQFHTGLSDLLSKGATRIVLDLRDNPGGYIVAAQRIASEFVSSGLIFSQESAGGEVKRWDATSGGVATNPRIPVAVLVNNGSASASEIVTAALRELGRATIIGQHTYGKNTVQVWAPLKDDGGVRITISRWFTPDHRSVAPGGIKPDITVDIPKTNPPENDLVLQRALQFLATRAIGETGPSPSASGPVSRLELALQTSYDWTGLAQASA
ncbi:MAG: hypothetical protein DLM71_01025 [Chloroflexi bacterium]|nr:MAG: hypothetical protein DLM71_01025 [Chloroflexota bacterium]